MSTFFERLREERRRLRLNQTEFAALAGMQKRAQVNYEKGDRSPDVHYMEAIAAAGADVQYIVTGVRAPAGTPPGEWLTYGQRTLPDAGPFSGRLRRVIGLEGLSDFARRCDVAESVLRQYLEADATPKIEDVRNIAAAGGVNSHWLLLGHGDSAPEDGSIGRYSSETPVRKVLAKDRAVAPPVGRPAPTRDDLARGTELDPEWPKVLEWVYDELRARRSMAEMPTGRKLRDMVTAVLVVLRLEEGEMSREKARRKIDAIL